MENLELARMLSLENKHKLFRLCYLIELENMFSIKLQTDCLFVVKLLLRNCNVTVFTKHELLAKDCRQKLYITFFSQQLQTI